MTTPCRAQSKKNVVTCVLKIPGESGAYKKSMFSRLALISLVQSCLGKGRMGIGAWCV